MRGIVLEQASGHGRERIMDHIELDRKGLEVCRAVADGNESG